MRVLALDSTRRAGTVALVDDLRVLVEREGDPSRSHAEQLPGQILSAVDAAGLRLDAIDLFAVAAGPGSFTGLRIGIATVQGLAMVAGRPVAPVSVLEALAHDGSLALPRGARVAAWMDAHRGEVFSALYEVGAGDPFSPARLIEIDPAAVGDPAATLARWEEAVGMPALLVGDDAVLHAPAIGGRAAIAPHPRLAGAIGLIAAHRADRGGAVDPAAVQPLYVRRPDAEKARDDSRRRPPPGR